MKQWSAELLFSVANSTYLSFSPSPAEQSWPHGIASFWSGLNKLQTLNRPGC
ncbi:hypothetical protein HZB60_01330 [candidate division KSB1 bacterium]|nr:hypothetical protein [candidate division KSB1 bacterium]